MSARILIVGREREARALEMRLAEGFFDISRTLPPRVKGDAGRARMLAAVKRARPDIVVLSGEAGWRTQFCHDLREDSHLAELPVVLLEEDGRGEGLAHGADEVVSPVPAPASDLLIARLRALARSKARLEELRLHARAGRRDFAAVPPSDEGAGRVALFTDAVQAREIVEKLAAAGERRPRWKALSRAEEHWVVRDLAPYSQPVRAAGRMRADLLLVALGEESSAGLALCGRLRAAASLRSATLVVIAAPGQEADIARALELGADDYLLTPLSRQEIQARLTLHLRRKRLRDALAGGIASHARHALTDPLTGLHNRRYMLARLPQMMRMAEQEGQPLSLLLIDLDRFKRVNDQHGHDAGDLALRRTAALMRGHMRRGDVLCRLGGEEFLAALPHTARAGAVKLAERLRLACMREPAQPVGRITASIGVCSLASGEKMGDFLKRADEALYQAKRAGRNCVI